MRDGVQYYWCVNCGNHGDFKKIRIIKSFCETCGYDEITKFDLEEILESEDLKLKFQKVFPSEVPIIPGPQH